ncbi:MAG: ATP-binding protein, partial [Bacteroidota bacterium]
LQSLPDLVGDKSMVRQIISNLIDNALKYQHPDRRLELKVSGYKNEEAVVLEFQDNGKGISEKDFDSIFHLFQRSDPSNTPGEGIGLSLVQRMLERLNGQIELESQLEQGSLFRIRFRS